MSDLGSLRYMWLSVVVAMVVGTFVVPSSAMAQEDDGTSASVERGGFNAQNFRPAAGAGAILANEGADTAGHLNPYGSVVFDYMSEPLVVTYGDGTEDSVVHQQLGAQMVLGVGVEERFQFELGIPVAVVNEGNYLGIPFSEAGIGDLYGRAKASVLSSKDEAVGFAAMLDVTVPTGDVDAYRGANSATVQPTVVGDTRFQTPAGEALVAANLGMQFQGSAAAHDLEMRTQLAYGLGASVEVVPHRLGLGIDLYGAAGLSEVRRQKNPLEMLAGARVQFTEELSGTVGAGGGLVGGVGSPKWRVLTGVTFLPRSVPGDDDFVEATEEFPAHDFDDGSTADDEDLTDTPGEEELLQEESDESPAEEPAQEEEESADEQLGDDDTDGSGGDDADAE